MPFACKICVMAKGLKGSDIASLPQTEGELIEHVEREHHLAYQAPGVTEEEADDRFQAKYPGVRGTCPCEVCASWRMRRKMQKAAYN